MEAVGNNIYQHKNKSVRESGYPHDGKYVIVEYARIKNPSTREWQDCVIYSDIKPNLCMSERKKTFLTNLN